jgi:hypothetical protein
VQVAKAELNGLSSTSEVAGIGWHGCAIAAPWEHGGSDEAGTTGCSYAPLAQPLLEHDAFCNEAKRAELLPTSLPA